MANSSLNYFRKDRSEENDGKFKTHQPLQAGVVSVYILQKIGI